MPGDFVAHHAVVGRRKTAAVMTPHAMLTDPVPDMGARHGLVVAPHAKVLLMTCHAALAVPFRHEPVAQRAPGVRMVARLPRVMTGNAIVPLVTGDTGFSALPRLIEVQIGRRAMEFDPVRLVRIRPGERDLAHDCSRCA